MWGKQQFYFIQICRNIWMTLAINEVKLNIFYTPIIIQVDKFNKNSHSRWSLGQCHADMLILAQQIAGTENALLNVHFALLDNCCCYCLSAAYGTTEVRLPTDTICVWNVTARRQTVNREPHRVEPMKNSMVLWNIRLYTAIGDSARLATHIQIHPGSRAATIHA